MFRLHSFHMYGVIGTAVVVGAISVWVIKRFQIKTMQGEKVIAAQQAISLGQCNWRHAVRPRLGDYGRMSGTVHRLAAASSRFRLRFFGAVAGTLGVWFGSWKTASLISESGFWLVYQKAAQPKSLLKLVNTLVLAVVVVLIFCLGWLWQRWWLVLIKSHHTWKKKTQRFFRSHERKWFWMAPDSATWIPKDAEGDEIRYGRELIVHTSKYLTERKCDGHQQRHELPELSLTCKLQRFWNNYSAKWQARIPSFAHARETKWNHWKRVNDCIERSLNGKALTDDSREMRAVSFILNGLVEMFKVMNHQRRWPSRFGVYGIASRFDKGKLLYGQSVRVSWGKWTRNRKRRQHRLDVPPVVGKKLQWWSRTLPFVAICRIH